MHVVGQADSQCKSSTSMKTGAAEPLWTRQCANAFLPTDRPENFEALHQMMFINGDSGLNMGPE